MRFSQTPTRLTISKLGQSTTTTTTTTRFAFAHAPAAPWTAYRYAAHGTPPSLRQSCQFRQFHASLPRMTVHNILSAADFAEVKKKPAVVIDAFAVWCGPCKMIAPTIARLSQEEQNQGIHFAKIDVDELPDLAAELGITAMPTFIFMENGKETARVTGIILPQILKGVESLNVTLAAAAAAAEGQAAGAEGEEKKPEVEGEKLETDRQDW